MVCFFYLSRINRYPGDIAYLSSGITKKAKEIISILIISNNGRKKEVQWIVDGSEGPIHDVSYDFETANEMFPSISFCSQHDHLRMIPLDQVKSTSPKIEQLKKEFNNKNRNNVLPPVSAPSTSTAENDTLISQLREQVARSQDLVIHQNDNQMKQMREMYEQQLKTKDDRTDLFLKQLELERAEHQKTRNLLHQIKMELKDVELYYLRLHQNESGQRRQREGEEEFKVKEEPKDQ